MVAGVLRTTGPKLLTLCFPAKAHSCGARPYICFCFYEPQAEQTQQDLSGDGCSELDWLMNECISGPLFAFSGEGSPEIETSLVSPPASHPYLAEPG